MPPEDSPSPISSDLDLSHLEQAVKTTNAFDDHHALVCALQETDELSKLRDARHSFVESHSLLPESFWIRWISDEQQLASDEEEQTSLLHLTEQATRDCPAPSLCLLRLKIVSKLAKVSHPHANIAKAFDQVLWLGAAAHFLEGAELWKVLESDIDFQSKLPNRPPLSIDTSDIADGCRVFESRLEKLAQDAELNEVIPVYLSYATFATEVNTFSAVSVYERCVQRFRSNHLVWGYYQDFCTSQPDRERCFYVSRRATRACPSSLPICSNLVINIAQSPTDIVPNRVESMREVIERVRPYVMQSNDLKEASNLTKFVWNAFLTIGAPSNLYDAVHSTLEFNVQGTPEWASALCHAAFIELSSSRAVSGIELLEQVVQARSDEARWWLTFVDFLKVAQPQSINDMFNRALDAMVTVGSVNVIEDAWLSFNASTDPDSLLQRTMVIVQKANGRRKNVEDSVFKDPGVTTAERGRKRDRISAKNVPKRYRSNPKASKSQSLDDSEKASLERRSDMDIENSESSFSVDNLVESKEELTDTKPAQQKIHSDSNTNDSNDKTTPGSSSKSQDSVEPRTIYLNNLPFRATEKDIAEAFEFAGKIMEIRLPRRTDGASKGFAYVEFEKDEQVDRALTKHNKPILGRAVWVRRSQPRPRKGKKSEKKDFPRSSAVRHKRLNLDNVSGPNNNSGGAEMSTNTDMTMEDDKTTADKSKVDGPKTQADFRAMFLDA